MPVNRWKTRMVSIFIDRHLDFMLDVSASHAAARRDIDSNSRFPFQILNAVEFEVRRHGDPHRSADDTVRNHLDRGALDAAMAGRSGP